MFLCPVLYAADDGQAEFLIGPNPLQVDVGSTAPLGQYSNHMLLHSFHNMVKIFTNGLSHKQILHIIYYT